MAKPDNQCEPTSATVGQLFQQHARPLVLFSRQWLTTESAEDVVQQVFIKLIAQQSLPDHPKAWLYKVVRNEAINALRSRSRRRKREKAVSESKRLWFDPTCDTLADKNEIQQAMEALPLEQREVVVMRVWGKLTLEQVAEILDIGKTTVFRRYQTALQTMKKILEQHSCNPTNSITKTSCPPPSKNSKLR